MSEEIVEQLTNSIGRYDNGDPFNEVHFTVTSYQGRNYLYSGTPTYGRKIAECVNGDYIERYGSLEGWLKHILKRELLRVETIREQISELNIEFNNRIDLIEELNYCGISK